MKRAHHNKVLGLLVAGTWVVSAFFGCGSGQQSTQAGTGAAGHGGSGSGATDGGNGSERARRFTEAERRHLPAMLAGRRRGSPVTGYCGCRFFFV